jgi:signal transduction histidine kinase
MRDLRARSRYDRRDEVAIPGGMTGAARKAGPRVLIVEDDRELRAVIAEELTDHGCHVICAEDGAHGLAIMHDDPPDLVLCDLFMPVMDGWRFRVEQRRDPRIARIPIIAMSASGTSAAMAIDADLFIAKPFEIRALVDAIDQVLAGHARDDDFERRIHHERLAAIGTLAAGLAHEINNPLTYVMLNLEAVDRMVPALPTADVRQIRELLGGALQGVERIRGLVASVRTLAHDKRNALVPIDPRAVLMSTLALMREGLRDRAHVVEDYGDVPFVMADEALLGQVFLNLLTNAIQAIPEGAPERHEIRVTTRTDDGERAIIDVADTGAGIPEYLLPRVFEPFFTTKPVGQGTGLGLSISQRIITRLGGDVTISSTVGRGTTVRVILPAGHGRLSP